MTCSRCSAEAIVKRGAATYCAKCALARDWEEIVMIVQEDRVEVASPAIHFSDEQATDEPATDEVAGQQKEAFGAAVAKADPDTNGELSSDPFA